MPDTAKLLIDEHEMFEQELIELEVIMSVGPVNYPNLIHVFNKIMTLWDSHEKKEEKYFKSLAKERYNIPYKQILFEHGQLKRHREAFRKSLQSGSEEKVIRTLQSRGKKMIYHLRKHMNEEDEIFYRLPEGLA